MAFFTSVKASVPIYQEESDDDTCSESSTLQSSADPARINSSNFSTPTPTTAEDQEESSSLREGFSNSNSSLREGFSNSNSSLREGFSTETVNTITEEDTTRSSSSQNSTPTPSNQSERFSYEVDPELGAFV